MPKNLNKDWVHNKDGPQMQNRFFRPEKTAQDVISLMIIQQWLDGLKAWRLLFMNMGCGLRGV
jgi:hypothetical protein